MPPVYDAVVMQLAVHAAPLIRAITLPRLRPVPGGGLRRRCPSEWRASYRFWDAVCVTGSVTVRSERDGSVVAEGEVLALSSGRTVFGCSRRAFARTDSPRQKRRQVTAIPRAASKLKH